MALGKTCFLEAAGDGQGRFTSLQEKMVWVKEEGTPFQGRQMS